MIAIKAYYDGNSFVPFEKRSFKFHQQAIIVLDEEKSAEKTTKSCRGIASAYANPSLIPQEEMTTQGLASEENQAFFCA